MSLYLLDTNICIYYFKGLYNLDKKFSAVGLQNISISEITLAELKFGAERSELKVKNRKIIDQFAARTRIIPIYNALDIYAREKARLRSEGKPVDDFDLLIGASAISNDLTLVTRNTKHFRNLTSIKLENWVE